MLVVKNYQEIAADNTLFKVIQCVALPTYLVSK